jgi:hypothetical protein
VVRCALLLLGLSCGSGALAQTPFGFINRPSHSEPQLELGRNSFALPIIEYRAPDGTWKRGQGIIIGRDIWPNTTVGIGFFRMKPRYEDPTSSTVSTSGKSKKVSLGFSMRF